jgi:TPR repeat protein
MAFALYLAGAEAGNALAQTNVGAMLAMGQGVAQDSVEGAKWLTRAAEQGDQFAQYNLATLYSKGQGVPLDPVAASGWYRKAAETGHYPSQARLGFLCANGIGVEKNRVEAYTWLSLAAQHGVGNALNALEAVLSQMSADEKRAGAASVDRWRSRTADASRHARLMPVPG